MRARRLRQALALAALAVAAACRDLPTTPAAAPPPAAGTAARTELRCTVAVQARTLACRAPAGARGARTDVIVGGQGVNVRLVSSNTAFDGGTGHLTSDVTVQNLLDQPMGTDGTAVTGTRVFFNSGPNVTSGTGTVTVLADSMGTFLASNQPYYKYDGVIQPRGVSPPVTWTFDVQGAVGSFDFVVYVDTQLPAETSILHWRPERGVQVVSASYHAVWAASPHDVFAASDGTIVHFDGNYWRAMDAGPCGCSVWSVWGTSGTNVYAVGSEGLLMHWTGGAWEVQDDPGIGSEDLFGIWGTSPSNLFAVGDASTVVHYDGSSWTASVIDSTGAPLYGVWGSSANDAWTVGDGGLAAHWDGDAWTVTHLPGDPLLVAVWGTGPSDVWAAGSDSTETGALFHFDGTDWSQVDDPALAGSIILSGWSGSATDVWLATADGNVAHWNGSSWTVDPIGYEAPLEGITGIGGQEFVVGDAGALARNTGSGWQLMSLIAPPVEGIWGSSAGDVWAVGNSFFSHGDGAGNWTTDVTPDGVGVHGVWGTGAGDVWAAGDMGSVFHYDGFGWNVALQDSASDLYAVWGSSPGDVWAVGDAGAVRHWDGASWSAGTVGTGDFRAVWGSAANDVFAVATDGTIERWDGSTWLAMNSGVGSALYSVWGSAANDVYAVGEYGTVLHYDGNGDGTWTPVGTPADPSSDILAVWGSGPGDVFATANGGGDLLHWDGSSWRIAVPYSANAGIYFQALWGTDSHNVYAGGTWGTIIHGKR